MQNAAKQNTTKELVITGLSIALVFVATCFINLRLPIGQGGLIHLGQRAVVFDSHSFWQENRCAGRCLWHGTV